MQLNKTTEKHFTYKQVAEVLKSEGLGHTRANVSYHIGGGSLKRVNRLGDPYMITRKSLESLIKKVKARGVK